MTPNQPDLYRRKPLNEITAVPDSIISVYVVENHIWAEGGSKAARAARRVERRTIEEFLVNPVRPFLRDILRQVAAPYTPGRKDSPIGQGYWIQAEFGSGKSHLLSFLGALALGGALGTIAVIVRQELVLFIMGGVFVVETLSVAMQVLYFKYTKKRYGVGKRILLMAPLHHHYEQKGWRETQVVVRFWIITMMLVLIGLATLKIR